MARKTALFRRWQAAWQQQVIRLYVWSASLGRRWLRTWQLWDDLQAAPDHRWKVLISDRYERYGWSPWAYLTVALIVLSSGSLLLFTGAVWGLFSAYRTARVITHERQRAKLDLLSMTPVGASGVRWLILAVTLHHDIDLRHFQGLRRLALSVVAFPFLMFAFIIGTVWVFNPAVYGLSTWYLGLVWLTLIPLVYLDAVYGLLHGGLMGIVISTYTRSETPVLACGALLVAQVAAYLAAVVAGLAPVGVSVVLGAAGWPVTIFAPVLALAAYLSVQEVITLKLWQQMEQRLGDAPIFA